MLKLHLLISNVHLFKWLNMESKVMQRSCRWFRVLVGKIKSQTQEIN